MPTGAQLFMQAEQYYAQNRIEDTFEYYVKAIKKIVKDENLLAQLPAFSPDPTFPRETLGAVWRNFIGFFRDPHLRRNKENSSDAYKLLVSYRPKSDLQFERFKTDRQKFYLAGMRITAGLALGLMAWDAQDRATAIKRYREALDLAAKYPQYDDKSKATEPWERYVSSDVDETRDNIRILLTNDETNARLMAEEFGITGAGDHRREILGIGLIRCEGDGSITFAPTFQVASDKCGSCGKRDAKLMKCSACKTATYCNAACQKADWQKHKPICRKLKA
ncbi:Histone-lysine N-methyltransferase smyd1 [Paramarasmius palmivorus]|uniref:Histone-lysine N-methyltransferase smyd1 n=1 Tax=Paramarasmius palmivorus TaxID=297713 RepID=A0AAW0CDA3_9AGAR